MGTPPAVMRVAVSAFVAFLQHHSRNELTRLTKPGWGFLSNCQSPVVSEHDLQDLWCVSLGDELFFSDVVCDANLSKTANAAASEEGRNFLYCVSITNIRSAKRSNGLSLNPKILNNFLTSIALNKPPNCRLICRMW